MRFFKYINHDTIDVSAEGGCYMAKQHDKQFKLDAIQYCEDHKELGVYGCAGNLGIGYRKTSVNQVIFLFAVPTTIPPMNRKKLQGLSVNCATHKTNSMY